MKINEKLIGQRLLVTDKMTGISRHERTLLELSPSGKRAKFNNGCNDFWEDVEDLEILELLNENKRI